MKPIYLDHNATTPVDPQVLDAMIPYMTEKFGNASSMHSFGREGKVALENSRATIAELLGAETSEIYFTSGGTEADNIALKGVARALKKKRSRVLYSAIEHSAIRQSALALIDEGFITEALPVTKEGYVTEKTLSDALDDNTSLVSIMHSNNEVGVIQDIPALVEVAHSRRTLFHTDAVQSMGKIPVNVDDLGVDLLTISAHKIYGPKGAGVVYARSGVMISPLVHGGSHEKGRRPGTENVAGAVGLAKALELVLARQESEYKRMIELSEKFIKKLRSRIENMSLNGPELVEGELTRVPSTVNLSFDGAEGEPIILSLDIESVAVSSGSACSSGAVEPSPVLLAMGSTPELAKSSIRFSMGKSTTVADIDRVGEILPDVISRIRKMSPQYAEAD
ncbi:MAG: cysteine desulfurase [candidate division Zixibacteria bacterium]|nr:cysteine desulfurase [candidate division Zixibacteria bacterium]